MLRKKLAILDILFNIKIKRKIQKLIFCIYITKRIYNFYFKEYFILLFFKMNGNS